MSDETKSPTPVETTALKDDELAAKILELEDTAGTAELEEVWPALIAELLQRLRLPEDTQRWLRLPMRGRARFLIREQFREFDTVNISNGGLGIRGHVGDLEHGLQLQLVAIIREGDCFDQSTACQVVWVNADSEGQGIAGLTFSGHKSQGRALLRTCYIPAYRAFLHAIARGGMEAVRKSIERENDDDPT